MTDRKQVIYDLERCTCHVPDACRDCSHDKGAVGFGRIGCMEALMEDAISLLKEQDAEIKEKNQRIWELLCERDSDDGR